MRFDVYALLVCQIGVAVVARGFLFAVMAGHVKCLALRACAYVSSVFWFVCGFLFLVVVHGALLFFEFQQQFLLCVRVDRVGAGL